MGEYSLRKDLVKWSSRLAISLTIAFADQTTCQWGIKLIWLRTPVAHHHHPLESQSVANIIPDRWLHSLHIWRTETNGGCWATDSHDSWSDWLIRLNNAIANKLMRRRELNKCTQVINHSRRAAAIHQPEDLRSRPIPYNGPHPLHEDLCKWWLMARIKLYSVSSGLGWDWWPVLLSTAFYLNYIN